MPVPVQGASISIKSASGKESIEASLHDHLMGRFNSSVLDLPITILLESISEQKS